VLATGSALAYAGVFAYTISLEPELAGLTLGIGAIGAVALALVLLRRMSAGLPWAVLLLAVAYTIALVARGSAIDGAAPLVAAGLLICAELAAWSVDEEHAISAERTVVVARVTALAVLVAVSTAAAGLVVAVSLAPGAGLAWTVVGAAAAVLVVGLAVRLTQQRAA
jgi:hypothetical protein